MLVFSDLKQDEGMLAVSGCCADSSRFAYLVNASVRMAMKRGDFLGTVTPIQVCVKNGCLAMPRYVGAVRSMNLCSRRMGGGVPVTVPVENLWYNVLNPRHYRTEFGSHLNQQPVMFSEGRAPAYSDIYGDGRLVRAYPACRADMGKTIRLFGVDNGNQPLKTNNGDGTYSEGVVITLDAPYGSTSTYVRRIDRVVKDVTQCQVFLYAYNAAADVLEDLAIYDPGETSPDYARYKLQMAQGNSCCSSSASVVALVKLAYIPVKFDTDLVLVDNLDALKLLVQSVRAGEAGDRDLSRGLLSDAINDLNRELEDAFPSETFSAANNVFGRTTFRNRCF